MQTSASAAIEADPTVYFTMNGPSEFHVVGTLKSWSIIDRLHLVQAPTLLISGKYDEATQVAGVDMSADKAAENAGYLRRVVKPLVTEEHDLPLIERLLDGVGHVVGYENPHSDEADPERTACSRDGGCCPRRASGRPGRRRFGRGPSR